MKLLFLSFFIFLTYISNAQLVGDSDGQNIEPSDTIGAVTQRNALQSFKLIFSGEPGKVALIGLLIPGGGQIYNRDYWKAPLVWAAEAGTISYYFYWRNLYVEFKRAHADLLRENISEYKGISDEKTLRNYRNNFRLNMERVGFGIAAIHLLGVMEAFTDSHLKEFDVSEDLSFKAHIERPELMTTSITSFGIQYRF